MQATSVKKHRPREPPVAGTKPAENYYIAHELMKARKAGEKAFPSEDIESLVEMSLKVVAANFQRYPELTGIKDEEILESIVRRVSPKHDITVTARNIDQEFYWEKKCKTLINCKKEDHGGSYKQAFIERKI